MLGNQLLIMSSKYISNLFDDPSLQGRKGRRVVRTSEKSLWKNMTLISESSNPRSISPSFSKKIKDMGSQFELGQTNLPVNNTSHRSITPRNLIETSTQQQVHRRALRPILLNGEIRDMNKTSSNNILKAGWEIKYVNRKLPNPN